MLTQSAAVAYVDRTFETLQFWSHYTAPLDFVEISAELHERTDGAADVLHPLPASYGPPVGHDPKRMFGLFNLFWG